jgi:hypothetical protein
MSAQALVLGVDSGATSGWAIWTPGAGICKHGTAKSSADRGAVVLDAVQIAHALTLPCVAVLEKWTPGGGVRWNPKTMIGLGQSRGRWLEQLEVCDFMDADVVSVEPNTWRAGTLSKLGRGVGRDEWKRRAVQACKARGLVTATDDEAEAILMAIWGAEKSAEVLVRSKVRRRAA